MVEADDVVERPRDPVLDVLDPRGSRLGVAARSSLRRVEAGLEQLDEQPGDVDVAASASSM